MGLEQRHQGGVADGSRESRAELGVFGWMLSGLWGFVRRSGIRLRRGGWLRLGLGGLIGLRPEDGVDEVAGYAVADDVDLGDVVGPHLGEEGRVGDMCALLAMRPQRQDVPDRQDGEDDPPKPEIAGNLVVRSGLRSLRSLRSLRLLPSTISR